MPKENFNLRVTRLKYVLLDILVNNKKMLLIISLYLLLVPVHA